MPFEKINAQKIVEDKIRSDEQFEKAYKEVEQVYGLIREVVRARKEKGLTQKELADIIGVKQQVISRFECERHIPTLDNFISILAGVGLTFKIERNADTDQEYCEATRY